MIKQKFRFGQKVWLYVMMDLLQFKIVGYDAVTKKWKVQWLSASGTFYVTEDQMHKRKPR